MIKKFTAIGALMLLGACASEAPPPAPTAAAPPPPQTFMVFFDLDSANLNATSQNVVKQTAAAFKSTGGNSISASGHTDRSGTPEYNQILSVRRANAVKAALVREGVPDSAVSTSGLGETRPLVPTADGVREPQNRRVEIALAKPGAVMGNDQAYCKAMSALYRRHISTSSAASDAGTAMAQCDAGNTAPAIPVLERLLNDARIPLPSRA
jgi:hypothetical protein